MATPNSLLITQLYVGYFNRAPDPEGLNYWVGRLQAGMSLVDIANSFAVQAEATSTYPWLAAPNLNVGVAEFVTQVYQNLFERAPDQAGLAFWVAQLVGGKPPGRFILDVISGATGNDKLVIDHKTEVGNYYADQALLRGLDWNVVDDLAGAAKVMDGDQAFWVSANSVTAGKASADAIITDQLGGPHNFIELTTGIDNIHVGANQTVLGNDLTFNPGDRIEGSSGTVNINYGAAAGPFFGTLNNLDLVNLTTTGPTVQVATNWTNIDVINVKQSTGALVLQDLQASSNDAPPGQTFTNYGLHDFVTGNTVTFNFDAQAVDGANTIVNLAVAEVTGGILMNSIAGQSIETVNLQIEDTPGFTSKIASFSAQGIQTLGISGGAAGLNFQIVAPLDPGLKTIDASKALSNLTLDVSKSTEAMNITLGSGNDKLITGDTLNPLPGFDTINGGAGTDEITAVFTSAGTRNPHMTNVEIATLTFNANATMSFLDVDGLNTINVLSSTNRISLHDMDSTVTTINVTGLQAPQGTGAAPIGVGRHEIYYDPTGFQTGGNNLTLNWTSAVAEDPHAGEIYFRSIRNVEFNHSGPFDTRFFDTIPDGDDAVFQFDDTLRTLVMNNKGTGDLYLLGGNGFEAIAGTRFMTDLSLNATGGDFAISGDIDTIRDLRHLVMTASGGNYLALDDVGSGVDAVNGGSGFGQMLETVDITTGSNSTVSFDELHAELSTISTFNVTVGNDGEVSINDIWAQDISDMTVIVNEEGLFDPTFHFTNQGDNLTVKGAGFINPFIFTNEAFANMDFSGLTVDNVVIDFSNAKNGSTLVTTKFADVIDASQGADNITSGLGDDDVDGNGGNDVIVDAGGNNDIRGDRGADTITLQSATGLDRIIVGFEGPADSDTVSGFSINNDRVVMDVSDMQAGPIALVRQGDGTTWQSQTPISPMNIDIQTVGGATTVLGQTDILSVSGTFADRATLEQALEVGGSRQITNVGANFNTNDAYVVQWTDTGGNAHISTARIIDEFPAGGANVTYNFDVQDMVVLTGVPVINQLNFEVIG